MPLPIAAIVSQDAVSVAKVFGEGQLNAIRAICQLKEPTVTLENADTGILEDVEIIFSTWGMIPFNEEQLSRLKCLKAVFYAAGATEYFAMPMLRHGIKISSAWQANGLPVAEYTIAQILLGLKNYFLLTRNFRSPAGRIHALAGRGAYGARIGLIGDGAVSRHVQRLLKNFALETDVLPTNPDQLTTASLERLFQSCQVVSNHLPDRDDMVGLLNGNLFRRMPEKGVFINTGRGRQVNEQELADVLASRTDITALLDVTWPEPPLPSSPLYTLPNVFLSPHLAGSVNDECHRMADYMIDECQRYLNGEPLQYEVKMDYLLNQGIK